MLPGAQWIWAPGYSRTSWSSDDHEFVFQSCFNIAGQPLAGEMQVAVDHGANVYVNGRLLRWVADSASATTVDITAELRSGNNCVSFWADNEDWCNGCTYQQNPAGLLVHGVVSYQP